MRSWKTWIGSGLFFLGLLIPYFLRRQLVGLDQLLQTISSQAEGKQQLNLGMKLIVLSQLIFGITWLNQVPFLDPYGFGLGSLSVKVKEAAVQIGFSGVLSLYANVLFLIFD